MHQLATWVPVTIRVGHGARAGSECMPSAPCPRTLRLQGSATEQAVGIGVSRHGVHPSPEGKCGSEYTEASEGVNRWADRGVLRAVLERRAVGARKFLGFLLCGGISVPDSSRVLHGPQLR